MPRTTCRSLSSPAAPLTPAPLQPPPVHPCQASTSLTTHAHCTPLPTPYLQAFYPRLYSRCQAEVFIAGNVVQGAALGFAEQLEAQLRER